MSYSNYSGGVTKVSREKLKQASTFQAGEFFDWTGDPFADISFVGLRNWLINVAGLDRKDDRYSKFFETFDAYIDLTSLKSIQRSSEEAKFNLLIADRAKKDISEDYTKRRPLFALAPEPSSRK